MTTKVYRQGDVILEKVDLDPRELIGYGRKASDKLEIASESGHRHVLDAEVYEYGLERLILVKKPSMLVHDQHPPILIEPGIYRLRFVRDYIVERVTRRRIGVD